MGTFRGCIDEAVGKGEITPEGADRARTTYDQAHASALDAFGDVDADRHAADAVVRQLELDALEAKRRRALMLRRAKESSTACQRSNAGAATLTRRRLAPAARRGGRSTG